MSEPIDLPLEAQFSLASFESQVERMSLTQAKEMLIELNRQMAVKEHLYKNLLKQSWGISNDSSFIPG